MITGDLIQKKCYKINYSLEINMSSASKLMHRNVLLNRFLPLIIAVICLFIFFKNKGFFSESKSEIITSDGHGYYGYLPAQFIYNDLSYTYIGEINKIYYPNYPIPEFCVDQNGKRVNKYYVGTAILIFPFFAAAHFITKLSNYPADGYSLYYQYAVAMAALFYLLVGLFFLNKVFQLFKIKPLISALLLIAVVFCTNLYHYAIFQSAMSHVYSFAIISAFIYFFCKLSANFNVKDGVVVSILLGLIALCRPSNLIILLITPLFFNNFSDYISWIKNKILNKQLGLYLLVFVLIISIQSYFWHKATSLYYFDSYKYEGFNFSNPYIFDFLFSFKKGFFIYTPFFSLLFFAFVLVFKQSSFKAAIFLIFFTVLVYLLSSWWNWYYGGGFGMRPLIDFYALFCLVLAIGLQQISKRMYLILIPFTLIIGIINIIQDYQIRNFILHWECMDSEKYFKVFLKTDDKYKGVLFYDNSTVNYEKYHNGDILFKDSCNYSRGSTFINFVDAKPSFNEKKDSMGYVNSKSQYSTGFQIPTSAFLKSCPHIIVKTYSDIFVTKDAEAEIIFTLEQNGTTQFFSNKVVPNFMESKTDAWFKSQYHAVIYGVLQGGILKCYLHHRKGNTTYIDNMKIEICELKTKFN